MWIQCEISTAMWFSYHLSLFTRQLRWRYEGQQEALRERKPAPHLVWDRETIQSGVNQSSQCILYSYSEYPSSTIYQVVPYAIADKSWKFHENLFIYLSTMLLTDTSPRLDGRPWNRLVMRETVYLIISCVVPNISWKFHENPFIRFP